jgi:hypothetical protein
MQRCAHMLRSRRLRSPKRPRQILTSCSEVHQKHITRMHAASSQPTTDPNSEHNAMGTHSSGQHAKGGVDLRSISARTHGQRLQPRSAPILEAPRKSRDPNSKRRRPDTVRVGFRAKIYDFFGMTETHSRPLRMTCHAVPAAGDVKRCC